MVKSDLRISRRFNNPIERAYSQVPSRKSSIGSRLDSQDSDVANAKYN